MNGDMATKDIPTILGLCNPLLDISAYVDQDILDKYNLKPNNVILAGEEHKDLCNELVRRYPVEYTAGGSAQNVMRVAAGILRRQNVKSKILFTGCISNDEFGEMMSKKATEDGVTAVYSVSEAEPTGTCAVCLTENGKHRSLCAFLGASQKFTDQHLRDNWDQLVANTDVIYFSGFLLAVSPVSYHLLGEYISTSAETRKRFCLNLSAPYVSAVFGSHLEGVMKHVDVVFGNDDEAFAYAEYKNWETKDVAEIAKKLCQEEKVRKSVGRLVVLTQGDRPIIVAQQSEIDESKVEIKYFPCKSIPDHELVDTNGAGDSFAGAFLSQFVQGASLEFCIEMGSYAAREIIKVSGVAIPNFADIPKLENP